MDKELLGIIGENVKKYREKANLTQAELAEKVGIGTASVSRIERGEKRMKMETLRAFADALDISVGLLFYQEGIIALTRACLENFGNKQTNLDDL